MERKVILVGHTPGETDDRVAAWLEREGYDTCWCVPGNGDPIPVLSDDVAATVVYGGVYDVHQKSELEFLRAELAWIECCLERSIPTLGLCLGAQLMADVLGVTVRKHLESQAEYGYYPLLPSPAAGELFPEDLMVLEAHWEGWFELPAGATHLASTEHFPQQAFRYGETAYAFQFHPEATPVMLERWVARRAQERATRPGAYSKERQLVDARQYDPAIGRWLDGFLSGWLNG